VGETLLAPNFTAVQTSTTTPIVVRVTYVAPDTLRIVESYQNQHRASTVTGPGVQGQLASLTRLEDQSFTKHGSVYEAEQKALSATGTRADALLQLTVDDGRMVRVAQQVTITSATGARPRARCCRSSRIGDWTVRAS